MSESEAREYIESTLWPKGPVCPHCNSTKYWEVKSESARSGVYTCVECGKQYTVTIGTVMQGSHLSLRQWLIAFHLMTSSKKGISALQLQRNLGLGSYKSAWYLAHRIRLSMNTDPIKAVLSGIVEVHIKPHSVPTYPVLWSHQAKIQQSIVFDADCEGIPRRSQKNEGQTIINTKINDIWKTASHCHFNRDFQFNSQSTGMQFTPRKTIGGRAWLSICFPTLEQEKTAVLWANTSLGLLLYWWYANKQQSGRGSISKRVLRNLPVLDVTLLRDEQISNAVEIFDVISEQPMLPIHLLDKDPVRIELDTQFALRVLKLDKSITMPERPLELIRLKLSNEPSIRGTK